MFLNLSHARDFKTSVTVINTFVNNSDHRINISTQEIYLFDILPVQASFLCLFKFQVYKFVITKVKIFVK